MCVLCPSYSYLLLLLYGIVNPNESLLTAADIISWILRFHPAFCLGRALFFTINVDAFVIFERGLTTVWSESILLYDVIFLAWQSVAYLLLAIELDRWSANPTAVSIWKTFLRIITCSWMCKGKSTVDITVALPEDDDVISEQDRVLNGEAADDLIVLSQLTKVYGNGKKAVNNLSLGIPRGECFGLLGINGAGKMLHTFQKRFLQRTPRPLI